MNKFTALFLGTVFALQLFGGINQNGSFQGMARDAEMEAFVREIFGMIDLHNEIPVVVHPRAPGCAYASTISTGQQFIGFDPACVGPLRTGSAYNWRAVGVMCHEVGHLLGGHTLNATNSHQEELEADEWSGWAMQRRGATLAEALTIISSYDEAGSKSHPGRWARADAIVRGWNRAGVDIHPSAPPSPSPTSSPSPTPAPSSLPPSPPPFSPPPQAPPPPPPSSPKTVVVPRTTERSWWEEVMTKKLPWSQ